MTGEVEAIASKDIAIVEGVVGDEACDGCGRGNREAEGGGPALMLASVGRLSTSQVRPGQARSTARRVAFNIKITFASRASHPIGSVILSDRCCHSSP